MTDAPKKISLVHVGCFGWRLWTADDADDPTVEAVPYILAAEHERMLAERATEIGSWRMVAEMNGATARTHCEQVAERDAEIARLRNDCRILLAQIAWLEECTGEGLEGEDAALVAEIAATVGDDNG